MLADPKSARPDRELHRPVAERARAADDRAGDQPVPRLRRQPARRASSARSSCSSRASSARTAASSTCSTRTTRSSTSGWRSTTGSRTSTDRSSAASRCRTELDMRRGLLGKGALLAVTSNPVRTSPVMRGKWVQATLLGVEPPQPPPGVEVNIERVDRQHRQRQAADDAPGAGEAPDQPDLLGVPPDLRAGRARARELRRRRRVAHARGRRRRSTRAASCPTAPTSTAA